MREPAKARFLSPGAKGLTDSGFPQLWVQCATQAQLVCCLKHLRSSGARTIHQSTASRSYQDVYNPNSEDTYLTYPWSLSNFRDGAIAGTHVAQEKHNEDP